MAAKGIFKEELKGPPEPTIGKLKGPSTLSAKGIFTYPLKGTSETSADQIKELSTLIVAKRTYKGTLKESFTLAVAKGASTIWSAPENAETVPIPIKAIEIINKVAI